jgi:tetratricopeptide (TPR) repeat protein
MLSNPSFSVTQTSDADTAFQTLSTALSNSTTGSSGFADAAAAAAKIRPKNATVQLLFGISKAQQSKFDEAIKSVDTAIELDSTLPDARLQRGLILAAAGKTSEAEQDLRKAIKDSPKDVRPLISLADLLLPKEDNLDECLKLAKDAIRITPDDPSGHMMLGRVLKHKKDYDGAIAELRGLIDSAPTWPDPRAAIALVYEAAGKMDLAEAQYRKLVEIQPQSPDAHLALIDFLIVDGKKDDAKKAIETARKVKMPSEALDQIKKMEKQLEGDEKEN